MRKPFHELFINHLVGTVVGILVAVGYYDIFDQTFILFDFKLALWSTGAAIVGLGICQLVSSGKDKSQSIFETKSRLQVRLLLFGILLSFWLPALLNSLDAGKPSEPHREPILTSKGFSGK